MGRPLCQRGIRLGKRCCQRFSDRQERLRANCGSALHEYPSLINKFFRHMASLADIARHARFMGLYAFH
jgi:hypothetical protein